MVDFWQVNLNPVTAIVIITGTLTFTITCYIVNKFKIVRGHNRSFTNMQRLKEVTIPNVVFEILIIAYVIVMLSVMVYSIQSKGLSVALSTLFSSYIASIKGAATLNLSTFLSAMFTFFSCAGYVWCYLLAVQWTQKRFNWRIMVLILESVIMGAALGKRGESVALLACLMIDLILMLRKEGSKKRSKRIYFFIGLIIIIIPLVFQTISTAMGRESYLFDPFEYISIYIGGPILNLDISIQRGNFNHPVFLSETLFSLYRSIGSNFNIFSLIYPTDRKFLASANGKRIGNVDTTFFDFYHDGGMTGVIILTIIMALIIQNLYKKIRSGTAKYNMFSTMLFSYMLWLVARSFFANSFYEWITLSTGRTLIVWWVLSLLLDNKKAVR